MALTLYNTLTKQKEVFAPVCEGEARIYHCGPTVYDYAHIGNLRAYVCADILRRTLEYNGYEVKQVINITDIGHLSSDADEGDDKMVRALKREGKPLTLAGLKEVADQYERAFCDDLRRLNIKTEGTTFPRASEHIQEEVEIVEILLKKNIAYKTSDGIYFDTAQFPSYGTRGGFALGEMKEGARVATNAEKRNPRDFALWKFSHGDIGFEAPFGKGFPGWHIECSAMSRKYLGQPFDIHTGGVDHIPTHHQNEMAQSEAAYGEPLANYWMHSEFVNVADGNKMAKSEENFLTLRSLTDKGIHPLAYRYLLLQTHYRSPLQFSSEALLGAQIAYLKLLTGFSRLDTKNTSAEKIKEIDDDLNTPTLIARVWELFKEKNRNAIVDADRILGLDIERQAQKFTEEAKNIPDDIKKLAAKREAARQAKDFAKADALRDEIRSAGYEVMDTDDGFMLRRKIS